MFHCFYGKKVQLDPLLSKQYTAIHAMKRRGERGERMTYSEKARRWREKSGSDWELAEEIVEELFLVCWCCCSSWNASSVCLNPFFFKNDSTAFSSSSSSIDFTQNQGLRDQVAGRKQPDDEEMRMTDALLLTVEGGARELLVQVKRNIKG